MNLPDPRATRPIANGNVYVKEIGELGPGASICLILAEGAIFTVAVIRRPRMSARALRCCGTELSRLLTPRHQARTKMRSCSKSLSDQKAAQKRVIQCSRVLSAILFCRPKHECARRHFEAVELEGVGAPRRARIARKPRGGRLAFGKASLGIERRKRRIH